MEATYYFDPACPFTWRTSRWLVAVAEAAGIEDPKAILDDPSWDEAVRASHEKAFAWPAAEPSSKSSAAAADGV